MAEVVVIDDEDEVPSQQRPISRYDSDSYLEVIDVCSEGGSEDASASGPQGTAGTGMDSAPAPPAPIAVANPAPEAHEHTAPAAAGFVPPPDVDACPQPNTSTLARDTQAATTPIPSEPTSTLARDRQVARDPQVATTPVPSGPPFTPAHDPPATTPIPSGPPSNPACDPAAATTPVPPSQSGHAAASVALREQQTSGKPSALHPSRDSSQALGSGTLLFSLPQRHPHQLSVHSRPGSGAVQGPPQGTEARTQRGSSECTMECQPSSQGAAIAEACALIYTATGTRTGKKREELPEGVEEAATGKSLRAHGLRKEAQVDGAWLAGSSGRPGPSKEAQFAGASLSGSSGRPGPSREARFAGASLAGSREVAVPTTLDSVREDVLEGEGRKDGLGCSGVGGVAQDKLDPQETRKVATGGEGVEERVLRHGESSHAPGVRPREKDAVKDAPQGTASHAHEVGTREGDAVKEAPGLTPGPCGTSEEARGGEQEVAAPAGNPEGSGAVEAMREGWPEEAAVVNVQMLELVPEEVTEEREEVEMTPTGVTRSGLPVARASTCVNPHSVHGNWMANKEGVEPWSKRKSRKRRGRRGGQRECLPGDGRQGANAMLSSGVSFYASGLLDSWAGDARPVSAPGAVAQPHFGGGFIPSLENPARRLEPSSTPGRTRLSPSRMTPPSPNRRRGPSSLIPHRMGSSPSPEFRVNPRYRRNQTPSPPPPSRRRPGPFSRDPTTPDHRHGPVCRHSQSRSPSRSPLPHQSRSRSSSPLPSPSRSRRPWHGRRDASRSSPTSTSGCCLLPFSSRIRSSIVHSGDRQSAGDSRRSVQDDRSAGLQQVQRPSQSRQQIASRSADAPCVRMPNISHPRSPTALQSRACDSHKPRCASNSPAKGEANAVKEGRRSEVSDRWSPRQSPPNAGTDASATAPGQAGANMVARQKQSSQRGRHDTEPSDEMPCRPDMLYDSAVLTHVQRPDEAASGASRLCISPEVETYFRMGSIPLAQHTSLSSHDAETAVAGLPPRAAPRPLSSHIVKAAHAAPSPQATQFATQPFVSTAHAQAVAPPRAPSGVQTATAELSPGASQFALQPEQHTSGARSSSVMPPKRTAGKEMQGAPSILPPTMATRNETQGVVPCSHHLPARAEVDAGPQPPLPAGPLWTHLRYNGGTTADPMDTSAELLRRPILDLPPGIPPPDMQNLNSQRPMSGDTLQQSPVYPQAAMVAPFMTATAVGPPFASHPQPGSFAQQVINAQQADAPKVQGPPFPDVPERMQPSSLSGSISVRPRQHLTSSWHETPFSNIPWGAAPSTGPSPAPWPNCPSLTSPPDTIPPAQPLHYPPAAPQPPAVDTPAVSWFTPTAEDVPGLHPVPKGTDPHTAGARATAGSAAAYPGAPCPVPLPATPGEIVSFVSMPEPVPASAAAPVAAPQPGLHFTGVQEAADAACTPHSSTAGPVATNTVQSACNALRHGTPAVHRGGVGAAVASGDVAACAGSRQDMQAVCSGPVGAAMIAEEAASPASFRRDPPANRSRAVVGEGTVVPAPLRHDTLASRIRAKGLATDASFASAPSQLLRESLAHPSCTSSVTTGALRSSVGSEDGAQPGPQIPLSAKAGAGKMSKLYLPSAKPGPGKQAKFGSKHLQAELLNKKEKEQLRVQRLQENLRKLGPTCASVSAL